MRCQMFCGIKANRRHRMINYQQSPTAFELFAVSISILLFAGVPAAPTSNFQQVNESNSSELERSLVTGTRTLLFYIANTQEPPVVTTENYNVAQIVWTVCDLLMQYELVSKVNSTGDLQVILRQNLMDACNWIRALNTTRIVNIDRDAVSNCSCLPEDVTFLHTHCARRHLFPAIVNASFLIEHYLQDAAESVNHCTWTDRVIPPSHQNNIKSYLPLCS